MPFNCGYDAIALHYPDRYNKCNKTKLSDREVVAINSIVHPIREDYLNGMSFVAIGEKYMIDPRTAKRYALNNLPLAHLDNRPFESILDPYKASIDKWLLNGRIFATMIHDRLIEQGCECGYTIVNDYVRKKIDEYEKNGLYKNCVSKTIDKTTRPDKASIEKCRMKGFEK